MESSPLIARAQIAAAVDRYLARFPDETGATAALRRQLEEDGAGILRRDNMRGHITTSALVLDPQWGRALLVHHRQYDLWLAPGGHYEPPGTLRESACREVAEEAGIDAVVAHPRFPLDVPLDIDTHSIGARPAKGEGPHRHHDFAYLGLALHAREPVPQEEEVLGARWVPLAALADLPDARVRRLARKLAAVLAD